jgi:hypothetical protein
MGGAAVKTENPGPVSRGSAEPMRARRFSVLIVLSLSVLGLAKPTSAQTVTGGCQMTDQQFKKLLTAGDAMVVKDINQHDAFAVAWRFSKDAVDISPSGIVVGRPAIEQRLAEEFKTQGNDFVEVIDQAHVSCNNNTENTGWFVGHWSVTRLVAGHRRRVTGYVAGVLERRNDFWKALLHVIGELPTRGTVEP